MSRKHPLTTGSPKPEELTEAQILIVNKLFLEHRQGIDLKAYHNLLNTKFPRMFSRYGIRKFEDFEKNVKPLDPKYLAIINDGVRRIVVPRIDKPLTSLPLAG